MEEIKLKYPSANTKHTLVGLLTIPPQPSSSSNKCIILVHGGMANKNSFYHKYLAKQLTEHLGYYTFRFDHIGNGESQPIFVKDTKEQYRNMMSGFWEDVDDLKATVEFLPTHGNYELQVECVVGHSRGGQVVHMFAHKYQNLFNIPRIIGVHMRYDLEYWRKQLHEAYNGKWVLKWKNRGQEIEHNVTNKDVNIYSEVPMHLVSELNCQVLNIYGLTGDNNTSQASYDTGDQMLTDGVVPFSDVEYTANLIKNHTLRFIYGVGHYYREDGANEKLYNVIKEWLVNGTNDKSNHSTIVSKM